MKPKCYILFDIGGTNMRIGLSKNLKKIEKFKVMPTPGNFSVGMKMLKDAADSMRDGARICAVSGGVAGTLNKEKNSINLASNLPEWNHKPFLKDLAFSFQCPVYLENDAALAGLGESVYGSGKENGIVAYITVSTGIGGARIVQGKIDANSFGFEPGHQIIDKNGKTLEEMVSGSSLEKQYGKNVREIRDKTAWEETGRILALGIHNTILHWSPDIVILGGSLMKSISLSLVRQNLKNTANPFYSLPPIKKSALGDIAGLYGAMRLLEQMLN